MKIKIALITGILVFLGSPMSMAENIDVKKYVGYTGYLLRAMSIAKKVHPDLAVPNLSEIKLGYGLLRDAYRLLSGPVGDVEEKIVRTPIEKASDVGLIAINSGSLVLGYYLRGTNPFLANILYGSRFAKGFVPKILDRFTGSALMGLKASYNLDDFTEPQLKQETYLSCSYSDPKNPSKNFKTWAYEKYIETDLKEKLKFHSISSFFSKSVLIEGRWISYKAPGGQSFAFGTIMDPLLLQAACIEAVSAYAKENKLEIDNIDNIGISAGNTALNNSYPIRFYVPMIMKAPTWQKLKPVIIKKAYLLTDQEGK